MVITLCKTISEDSKKTECFEYWPEQTKDSLTDERLSKLFKDLRVVVKQESFPSQYIQQLDIEVS